jgi:hypothetical protein
MKEHIVQSHWALRRSLLPARRLAFAQSSGTWSAGISTRNGLPFVHAPSTRNNGLSAFAQVPATWHQRATDYYNMVPSSLGPADRFGGASQP